MSWVRIVWRRGRRAVWVERAERRLEMSADILGCEGNGEGR